MWMKPMLLSWLTHPCVYLCACVRACVRARAPPLPAHALQANLLCLNTPKATRAETLQAPNAAGRKHRHEGQRRLTGVVMQAHAVDAVASSATFKPATLELHHGNLAAGGFGSCDHRETLEAAERGPAFRTALKVGGAAFTATAARVRLPPLTSLLVALMALMTFDPIRDRKQCCASVDGRTQAIHKGQPCVAAQVQFLDGRLCQTARYAKDLDPHSVASCSELGAPGGLQGPMGEGEAVVHEVQKITLTQSSPVRVRQIVTFMAIDCPFNKSASSADCAGTSSGKVRAHGDRARLARAHAGHRHGERHRGRLLADCLHHLLWGHSDGA
jgi:hypothetical protein